VLEGLSIVMIYRNVEYISPKLRINNKQKSTNTQVFERGAHPRNTWIQRFFRIYRKATFFKVKYFT